MARMWPCEGRGGGDGGDAGEGGEENRVSDFLRVAVRRGALWLAIVWVLPLSSMAAQRPSPPPPPSPPADSSRELQVYLMTFGPGRQVWERFGHNAIWLHDPASGTGEAYNYGLFDFHQENFLLRFARGQMWYWMAGFPASQYVRQYERHPRSVGSQGPERPMPAKAELQNFLRWNAEPEHRFYHYDDGRDNRRTRVREASDRVVGGGSRQQTGDVAS